MYSPSLQQKLKEKSLSLSEELTPKHISAIEFLFKRMVNNTSFVNKEEFALETIQGNSAHNLKYAKKLLEELIFKATFLRHSLENRRKTLIQRGNLLQDFSWDGSSNFFKVTWNAGLFPPQVPTKKETTFYKTKAYFSLRELFLNELGREKVAVLRMTFPELSQKVTPKRGGYFYKGNFLRNPFLQGLLLPNLEKLRFFDDLDVSWEKVVIFQEGDKPIHGLEFTIRRTPT